MAKSAMKPSQLAVDQTAGAGDIEVSATLRLPLTRGGGGIFHGASRPVSRHKNRRGWIISYSDNELVYSCI